jgi:glycosyltransferase 2 family protein
MVFNRDRDEQMRRWLFLTLKLVASAGLLYWAFRSVDLDALALHLARLDALWVIAAFVVLCVQIAISAQRWSLIAVALGAALPLGRAIHYTFIGNFFNQTLPSTIGGDAMRSWLLGRTERLWKIAIYSVIVDRAAGVGFLAVLVAVCLPWSLELITAPEGRAAVFVIGLGGVAGLIVGLLLGFVRAGERFASLKLVRFVVEIAAAARRTLLDRSQGLIIVLESILIHLLTVAAAWCLARAIAITPNALNMLILIPPVMLISMIPISIGGWGIRESTMVVAFGYVGIEPSHALAISVLLGGSTFVIGIVGGAIWFLEREAARPTSK